MSTGFVPQQPHHADSPHSAGAPQPSELPPDPPHASEATRLLCAGTYLDPAYRDRVIDELYVNQQRFVAPSLGFDAARVLAHALRARHLELLWAAAILGLWVVGLPLSGWLLVGLLWPSLLIALVPWIRDRGPGPQVFRTACAFLARWCGRLLFAFGLYLIANVAAGQDLQSDSDDPADSGEPGSPYASYDPYASSGSGESDDSGLSGAGDALGSFAGLGGDEVETWHGWLALAVFALIALCEAARRGQFARVLSAELSPQRFPDVANDPAEHGEGARFRRLRDLIRREQHAPLIMYDEAAPFRGAGEPYDTWVLTVELRPDAAKKQQPINNRAILERIRPMLEQLRVPAPHAGTSVRDRLRRLEIDECVFLPVEGLTSRDQAPYDPGSFEQHRQRSVEEGGEKRRHFLRVRVGGWEEELVVTVHVRIHTQGRMLVLEVAPHVLTPVDPEFKNADRIAHRFRTSSGLGKAVAALLLVPGSAGRALVTLARGAGHAWRLLMGDQARALPEGPALSVREVAAVQTGSTFQEMDVARYLRGVQERIGRGVRLALAEAGYETGEFVQKIVNVSNGAVHIDRVEGSTFAIGEHASATSGGPGPQKGTVSHGT
ncbi:hypothetical protein HCJ93_11110 [Streptomyces sp. SBST2-5]|uniref:Uncharacterized protein n=1 Tax=Streptomyces composti TaxID=2720025 RepID=A0ABX1AAV8_9ACTN|nr:hypothetical protein [Streptomyces composti]NJP50603.1 hypothetical protein [Streptomyces composti]